MSRLDQARVVGAIGEIYQAPGSGDWLPALDALLAMFDAHAGNLMVDEHAMGASRGIGPDLLADYGRYFHRVDDRLRLAIARPGMVLTNSLMGLSDRAFENSEYHHDFLRRLDAFYAIGISFLQDGVPMSVVLHRRYSAGEFDDSEVGALTCIVPHLLRSMTLWRRLHLAEVRLTAGLELLDALDSAFVVVAPDANSSYCNRAAQKVLAGVGVRFRRAAFEGGDSVGLRALNAAIETARRMPSGLTEQRQWVVRLNGGGGEQSLVAVVIPILGSLATAEGKSGAAVFLSHPGASPRPLLGRLRELYGLTPAQARLGTVLATGASLKDAAGQLKVSRETLRTHLRELFRKTGTNRQSQLVRMLAADALLPDPSREKL